MYYDINTHTHIYTALLTKGKGTKQHNTSFVLTSESQFPLFCNTLAGNVPCEYCTYGKDSTWRLRNAQARIGTHCGETWWCLAWRTTSLWWDTTMRKNVSTFIHFWIPSSGHGNRYVTMHLSALSIQMIVALHCSFGALLWQVRS